MLNYDFVPSDGSDLGAVIAQIICKDPLRAARAGQKSADAMTKIIRRSLGKTGSVLFRILKSGFKERSFGLEPRRTYSLTGAVMSKQIDKYQPDRRKQYVNAWPNLRNLRLSVIKSNPPVGEKFSGLMQYFMNDKNERDISTLEIGLIPSRRGGQLWADRFADWQDAGEIKLPYGNRRTMMQYFRSIEMPLSAGTILKRPARPVIQKVQDTYNPFELFEKHFVERLSRGLK